MRRLNAQRPPSTDNSDPKMDPIHLRLRPNHSRTKPKPGIFLLYSFLTSLSLLSLYLFFFYFLFPKHHRHSTPKFSIIIDGGSSGTRIHVLKYHQSSDDGNKNDNSVVFDFGKGGLVSMKVSPGLSAHAEDPDGAGRAIEELIEFARSKVPREKWDETEIRLMATAGLRLVKVHARERVLEECRKVLRRSGFVFRDDWATVISGTDEGVYAWVVANYALGTLGGDPEQTTGIIELGGASTQVTFSSREPLPSEFLRAIKFGNVTYNLYSHSFLQFGQDVALESLKEVLISGDTNKAGESPGMLLDPCTPKGYTFMEPPELSSGSVDHKSRFMYDFQAGGNFSECRSAALKLLQTGKDKCTYHHCYIGSTFTPELQGKFLATENFFYTAKFFGLTQRALLSDFIMAGQQFCGEDWSVLKKRHHSISEEDLLRNCFSSAYIVALLHDSLGVDLNDERIEFANQVGNTPLDWALGAFILQSTAALYVEKPIWIASILQEDLPTTLSIVAILVLCILIVWTVTKWKKPQLKTIYDLEKGRYIITRINRH